MPESLNPAVTHRFVIYRIHVADCNNGTRERRNVNSSGFNRALPGERFVTARGLFDGARRRGFFHSARIAPSVRFI